LVQFWQLQDNLTKKFTCSMKNLTLLFIPLLFSLTAIAQRNGVDDIDRENFFRIGAKAGFNVNKVPGMDYSQAFAFNYQLGGFMQFNFSRRFGIQPEANFVQVSSTEGKVASDITDDLFRGGPQKAARLDYLEIPVLLNINVGESRHVKLQLGPAYGIALAGATQNKTEGENIQYKNGELSAIGGFFIQLPFVNLGARYKAGLSKVYSNISNQSGTNQAIEVFTGFTF
jgi:hypothetical protein